MPDFIELVGDAAQAAATAMESQITKRMYEAGHAQEVIDDYVQRGGLFPITNDTYQWYLALSVPLGRKNLYISKTKLCYSSGDLATGDHRGRVYPYPLEGGGEDASPFETASSLRSRSLSKEKDMEVSLDLDTCPSETDVAILPVATRLDLSGSLPKGYNVQKLRHRTPVLSGGTPVGPW